MFIKTIAAVVTTALITTAAISAAPAHAASNGDLRMIPIIVNGYKVKFPDTEPYIDTNGRTMVPVRLVSEKLGGTVTWDAGTQIVTINNGSKTISLPIGSNIAKVNGQSITLDTQAVLTEGRTMVPLRFVSEALSSKVTWDEDAHAVQVSDETFLDKVAKGEIKLDPWGRQISDEVSDVWNMLVDVPDYAYSVPFHPIEINKWSTKNKRWFSHVEDMTKTKKNIDRWANRIKEYYAAMLNIDYRTVDTDSFINSTLGNMSFVSSYFRGLSETALKDYIAFAKTNHIVAKGYADPETYLLRSYDGLPILRTHFKFMIIQADDSTQTFMDNWNPSEYSESPKLDLGVWYDGYADVRLYTNSGNQIEKYLSMESHENMFQKGRYIYKVIE